MRLIDIVIDMVDVFGDVEGGYVNYYFNDSILFIAINEAQ